MFMYDLTVKLTGFPGSFRLIDTQGKFDRGQPYRAPCSSYLSGVDKVVLLPLGLLSLKG